MQRYEGVTDPSEAGRRVNEGFVPLISQVPGFVAYHWVNAGGGVMGSTSVFQDQSGGDLGRLWKQRSLILPHKIRSPLV
jgi:hypothetical protein